SSPYRRSTRRNCSTVVAQWKVLSHTIATYTVAYTTTHVEESSDELVRGSDAYPGGVLRQAHGRHDCQRALTGVSAEINFNKDDFTASPVQATIDARTLSTRYEQRDAHLK